MTRQEVQRRDTNNEGDPKVKARIRQIRFGRARKRMMAAVPKAAVVITNPTHYAVALTYESGKMARAGLRRQRRGRVWRSKFARWPRSTTFPSSKTRRSPAALYASVDVDERIQPEHYKAVAQVIGYVMRLEQNSFWRTRAERRR